MFKIIKNYFLFSIAAIFLVACGGDGDSDAQSITVSKQDFNTLGTILSELQLLTSLSAHGNLLTHQLVKGTFTSGLYGFIDDGIVSGNGCDSQNRPKFSQDKNGEFNLSLSVNSSEKEV